MIKKGFIFGLICALTFGMTMPVFAAESDTSGTASGVTTLAGEVAYTTAYTLTIPADVHNIGLGQDAIIDVGTVNVKRQNNNAEFDPAKKVSVSVNYTGELENTKNSSNKIFYKLQQSKGDSAATDIASEHKLDFFASEIDAGNVNYNLKLLITKTNIAAGTYTGTINFSAKVEDVASEPTMISFQVGCSDDDKITWKTYEVAEGTTWGEFAETEGLSIDNDTYICCDSCECWLKDRYGADINRNVTVDEVIKPGNYTC